MKKYKVYGTVTVGVSIEIEADSEEDAIEQAGYELDDLDAYCGNSGTDKLIGVSGSDESVWSDGGIEWQEAEEISGEDEE